VVGGARVRGQRLVCARARVKGQRADVYCCKVVPELSVERRGLRDYRAVARDLTIIAAAILVSRLRTRVRYRTGRTLVCMASKRFLIQWNGIILKQNSMGRHGE